jgi:hypothetical protein
MRPKGDMIHAFYQAVDSKSFTSKSFGPVTGLRLMMSNGEQKIPSGGFALFVLDSENGKIDVEGRRLMAIGWVVIRGVPYAKTGHFRMEIEGKPLELHIIFRKQREQVKSITYNSVRMEFELMTVSLNNRANEFFLDKKILRKTSGDLDIDALKAFLSGPFNADDVAIFDSEGGFTF